LIGREGGRKGGREGCMDGGVGGKIYKVNTIYYNNIGKDSSFD
jgi:hypothetical protein